MATYTSVYSGPATNSNSDLNDRVWMEKAVLDSSGVTTLYVTVDGTPSGTSYFQSFANVDVTASSNSLARPAFGTLVSIGADLRSVILQALSVKLGSGATVTSAPSGTTIYCTIIGQAY